MERILDNKYTLGCALVLEKYGLKCDAATEFGEKKEGTEKVIIKQHTLIALKKVDLKIP